MMRKPKSRSFNITPEYPCKYNCNKDCYNYTNPDCERCSKNPHRFDNREITKGQIIALVGMGFKESEVSNWTFLQAGDEIRKYRGF